VLSEIYRQSCINAFRFPLPASVFVVQHVWRDILPAHAFRSGRLRRDPRHSLGDGLLYVSRAEKLGAEILAQVFTFRMFRSGTITEQKTLVKFFVDEMLVDRFRTLCAPDGIDHQVVLDSRDSDDVRDDALDDAEFFLGSDPPGKADYSISDRDVDVVRIERSLLVESVAYQRANLAVTQVVNVANVLVVPLHRASGSAIQGRSGYRKNRSEAPSVSARLFFQNDRAWLFGTADPEPLLR
jgi:hypothetical protein